MNILICIYVFILGSIFASFIYCYSNRALKGESIIKPRSHCDNCNHVLTFIELIPIISYIILRGKCIKCKKSIGITSFILEVLTGILFLAVYLRYGISYNTLIGFVIVCLLLSICITDFKEMIILDGILIVSTLLISLFIFLDSGIKVLGISLLNGFLGFVLFLIVKYIGYIIFKRESLGDGDIKLAFVMGLVLSYNVFLISLITGSIIALPYGIYITRKSNSKELAFGPFLGLGMFICFYFKYNINTILNYLLYIK